MVENATRSMHGVLGEYWTRGLIDNSGKRIETLMSVSYTHLDVYKRQIEHTVTYVFQFQIRTYLIFIQVEFGFLGPVCIITPVSYTHLSYNGIDNVFFVNLLNLPQIDTDLTPYVVLNIEEPKHYRIKERCV